uniref:uncharacterized protein LOC117609067 n=1 Tax=Osmia lignaria TaxID=473952 RepID=UPI0014784882|nr:uncharacterized protein LOC117609067 [Osmia lignaria]
MVTVVIPTSERKTEDDINNLLLKTAGFFYCLTTTIVTLYTLSAVFHVAGTAASLSSIEGNESISLLLKMDLPFETNTSPSYELLVIAQFLHQTTGAFSFGVFSALVLIVVLHAGYQIDIMCQTIMDVSLQDKEQLKLFIIRHQDVIVFVEKIGKYFTFIALSQLAVWAFLS